MDAKAVGAPFPIRGEIRGSGYAEFASLVNPDGDRSADVGMRCKAER